VARLTDKIAIVTGGSRGIGRAIVEQFLAERANVVATARSAPQQAFPESDSFLFLAADAALWAFRVAGVHYQLRYDAFKTRNDWVEVLREDKRDDWPHDTRELTVTQRLRTEAIERKTTSPSFLPRKGDAYWVE